MKKFTNYLVILAIILAVILYTYRLPLLEAKNYFSTKLFPCSSQVTYSIGSIDPKFGVSQNQLIDDLAQASEIWNAAEDKNLFAYDQAKGSVKINLIYDYRQAATDQLKSIGITINDDEDTYNSLKAKYDKLQAEYQTQKSVLDGMVAKYNQDKAAYEEQVAYWNARGGAPKTEYQKLQQQHDDLQRQASQIKQAESNFNQLVDTINALATALNTLISQLNLKVANYNSVGTQTGSEFQEGVFKSSINSQEIDIYQFENEAKLKRVLSHELGHAIGLEHVDDPSAIMYKINQGSDLKLADADKKALDALCSSKFNFSNFAKITP